MIRGRISVSFFMRLLLNIWMALSHGVVDDFGTSRMRKLIPPGDVFSPMRAPYIAVEKCGPSERYPVQNEETAVRAFFLTCCTPDLSERLEPSGY